MKFIFLAALALVLVAPAFAQDCGCETAPLPDVVLLVNGKPFRQPDVFSPEARKKIADIQQTVIDERSKEVQLLINSKLLAAEARKRGMSPTRLVKQEVYSKVADPTDEEIREFYSRNRGSISGTLDEARPDITAYIRNKRERSAAEAFAEQLRSAAKLDVLVENATPPATPAQRARVFAKVNGDTITSGDVEDALRPTIFAAQEQVYQIRKDEIDRKTNDTLLDSEAMKRGIPRSALYAAEVTNKLPVVTDADARAFFDKNKERIKGDFETTRERIKEFLAEDNKTAADKAFARKLRDKANVSVFLPEPVPPVYAIDTEGRPSKGPRNAPVTIVEFIDIECRTCGEPYRAVERIFNESGGKVRLVVMHYPLAQHKNAPKAAEAAEAAREQGKFFEYVDLLFKNQTALEVDSLKQYATQLGLDRKKFDAALGGTRLSDLVDHDQLEGDKMGINRTPTIYINGRRNVDVSYDGLKKAVDAAAMIR